MQQSMHRLERSKSKRTRERYNQGKCGPFVLEPPLLSDFKINR